MIQRDILQALDSGRVAALVLLDLSAAFDTIDHSILIERLQKLFGISGDALTWIVSYVRRRYQQVLIGDTASAEVVIEYTEYRRDQCLARSYTHCIQSHSQTSSGITN